MPCWIIHDGKKPIGYTINSRAKVDGHRDARSLDSIVSQNIRSHGLTVLPQLVGG